MTVALTWLLTLLTVTLLAGIWIGPALIGISVIMLEMFTSRPTMRLIGVWSYNVLTTSEIVSLPMFILMGELLFRTRLSQSLFSGVAPWVGFLPGRLLHTTIIGCSLFSMVSGSSAATTQVVGRITLTELLRRGYDKGIAVGSLAGGGMLGFLIPPSIVMIIYAVLAEESLLRLFTASFLPGFIVAGALHGLHRGLRAAQARDRAGARPARLRLDARRPAAQPQRARSGRVPDLHGARHHVSRRREPVRGGRDRRGRRAHRRGATQRTLDWRSLREACLGTVQTTCMIGLIVLGAFIVGTVLANLRLPQFI